MTFKIHISIVCFCFLACLPAAGQDQANVVILTNIDIWDGSSSEIRKNQHILIVSGEVVTVGPQLPTLPADATILDFSGHVALGTIVPGLIANFVVLDADPQEDISVLARAD